MSSRGMPTGTLCIVFLSALYGVARGETAPDWIDAPLIFADDQFFYQRAKGTTLEAARTAAARGFAELVRVTVETAFSDEQSLVVVEGTADERTYMRDQVVAFTKEDIRGSNVIATALVDGETWVILEIPRETLPAYLNKIRDRRFHPAPAAPCGQCMQKGLHWMRVGPPVTAWTIGLRSLVVILISPFSETTASGSFQT